MSPPLPRTVRLRTQLRDDSGMSTVEYAIGTLAARILFTRIDGDTTPPRTHIVPTTLIPRGSGEIPPP